MRNTLPDNWVELVSLGSKATAGLYKHQDALDVKRHRDTAVLGCVSGLTDAADAYRGARRAKSLAFGAQATAYETAGTFISAAISALIPYLGRSAGPLWLEVGLSSLTPPGTLSGRLEVVRSLDKYFKKYPAHENPAVKLGDKEIKVTQKEAEGCHTALSSAINGVAACKSDTKEKRKARESAKTALHKRLRGMINELSDLMPEDDTRWPAFGLNVPGETQAPEAVTDVQVEPAGAGRLRVEFEDSARSDRYQIEIQIVGTDLNYRRVVTVRDSSAEIGPLPVSARVKVRVVAANDAGESSPSEAVEAVVPALSEAA